MLKGTEFFWPSKGQSFETAKYVVVVQVRIRGSIPIQFLRDPPIASPARAARVLVLSRDAKHVTLRSGGIHRGNRDEAVSSAMAKPEHPTAAVGKRAELQETLPPELRDGDAPGGDLPNLAGEAVSVFPGSFQMISHGGERAQFVVARCNRVRRQSIRTTDEAVEQSGQRRCWTHLRDGLG